MHYGAYECENISNNSFKRSSFTGIFKSLSVLYLVCTRNSIKKRVIESHYQPLSISHRPPGLFLIPLPTPGWERKFPKLPRPSDFFLEARITRTHAFQGATLWELWKLQTGRCGFVAQFASVYRLLKHYISFWAGTSSEVISISMLFVKLNELISQIPAPGGPGNVPQTTRLLQWATIESTKNVEQSWKNMRKHVSSRSQK